MNKTLSPQQVRLAAVLGLVIVCVGALWLLVLRNNSGSQSTSSTPAVTAPTTTPAPGKSHPTSPAQPTRLATHGLPLVVARALHKHKIVVVSLSSPHAGLDQLASAESQAAASGDHVGYVKLDVFRQRKGMPILRKFGITDTPAVLVFRRPATVYAYFKGFVDRNVIEQAVADAR